MALSSQYAKMLKDYVHSPFAMIPVQENDVFQDVVCTESGVVVEIVNSEKYPLEGILPTLAKVPRVAPVECITFTEVLGGSSKIENMATQMGAEGQYELSEVRIAILPIGFTERMFLSAHCESCYSDWQWIPVSRDGIAGYGTNCNSNRFIAAFDGAIYQFELDVPDCRQEFIITLKYRMGTERRDVAMAERRNAAPRVVVCSAAQSWADATVDIIPKPRNVPVNLTDRDGFVHVMAPFTRERSEVTWIAGYFNLLRTDQNEHVKHANMAVALCFDAKGLYVIFFGIDGDTDINMFSAEHELSDRVVSDLDDLLQFLRTSIPTPDCNPEVKIYHAGLMSESGELRKTSPFHSVLKNAASLSGVQTTYTRRRAHARFVIDAKAFVVFGSAKYPANSNPMLQILANHGISAVGFPLPMARAVNASGVSKLLRLVKYTCTRVVQASASTTARNNLMPVYHPDPKIAAPAYRRDVVMAEALSTYVIAFTKTFFDEEDAKIILVL